MSKEETTGIGFFEKYLTLWVLLCMATGILIGRYLPGIPAFLGNLPEIIAWNTDDIKGEKLLEL